MEAQALGADVAPFLVKLWQILRDQNLQHVVAWDEGGISFQVKQPNELAATVLPQYFRHNNYSSFQRQLNYFGFRKIGKSSKGEPCRYQHNHFVRDKPSQVVNIRRKTNHSTSRKGKSSDAVGHQGKSPAPVSLKMNESVTCKGYLQVQNYKAWTGWSKRFFVLEGSALLYFSSHKCTIDSSHNQDQINHSTHLAMQQGVKDPCVFYVITEGRSIVLRANSTHEMMTWLQAFKHNITVLRANFRQERQGQPQQTVCKPTAAVASATAVAIAQQQQDGFQDQQKQLEVHLTIWGRQLALKVMPVPRAGTTPSPDKSELPDGPIGYAMAFLESVHDMFPPTNSPAAGGSRSLGDSELDTDVLPTPKEREQEWQQRLYLRRGMRLCGINGQDLFNVSYAQVKSILHQAARPVHLTFRGANPHPEIYPQSVSKVSAAANLAARSIRHATAASMPLQVAEAEQEAGSTSRETGVRTGVELIKVKQEFPRPVTQHEHQLVASMQDGGIPSPDLRRLANALNFSDDESDNDAVEEGENFVRRMNLQGNRHDAKFDHTGGESSRLPMPRSRPATPDSRPPTPPEPGQPIDEEDEYQYGESGGEEYDDDGSTRLQLTEETLNQIEAMEARLEWVKKSLQPFSVAALQAQDGQGQQAPSDTGDTRVVAAGTGTVAPDIVETASVGARSAKSDTGLSAKSLQSGDGSIMSLASLSLSERNCANVGLYDSATLLSSSVGSTSGPGGNLFFPHFTPTVPELGPLDSPTSTHYYKKGAQELGESRLTRGRTQTRDTKARVRSRSLGSSDGDSTTGTAICGQPSSSGHRQRKRRIAGRRRRRGTSVSSTGSIGSRGSGKRGSARRRKKDSNGGGNGTATASKRDDEDDDRHSLKSVGSMGSDGLSGMSDVSILSDCLRRTSLAENRFQSPMDPVSTTCAGEASVTTNSSTMPKSAASNMNNNINFMTMWNEDMDAGLLGTEIPADLMPPPPSQATQAHVSFEGATGTSFLSAIDGNWEQADGPLSAAHQQCVFGSLEAANAASLSASVQKAKKGKHRKRGTRGPQRAAAAAAAAFAMVTGGASSSSGWGSNSKDALVGQQPQQAILAEDICPTAIKIAAGGKAAGHRSAPTGRVRGGYKCRQCGAPKAGHTCPFKAVSMVRETSTQCELQITGTAAAAAAAAGAAAAGYTIIRPQAEVKYKG